MSVLNLDVAFFKLLDKTASSRIAGHPNLFITICTTDRWREDKQTPLFLVPSWPNKRNLIRLVETCSLKLSPCEGSSHPLVRGMSWSLDAMRLASKASWWLILVEMPQPNVPHAFRTPKLWPTTCEFVDRSMHLCATVWILMLRSIFVGNIHVGWKFGTFYMLVKGVAL